MLQNYNYNSFSNPFSNNDFQSKNYHRARSYDKRQLFNPRSTPFHKMKDFSIKPKGLSNIGATCYMNATLQCFYHVKKLTEYLALRKYVNDNIKIEPYTITYEYMRLIKELYNKDGQKEYAPYSFKDILGKKNSLFEGVAANDSKDLILFLIEELHRELMLPKKNIFFGGNGGVVDQANEIGTLMQTVTEFGKERSIVKDIFYFMGKTESVCQNCKNILYNFQAFNFIIFPLEKTYKDSLKGNNYNNAITINNNMNNMNNMNAMMINMMNNMNTMNFNNNMNMMNNMNNSMIMTNNNINNNNQNMNINNNLRYHSAPNYSNKIYNNFVNNNMANQNISLPNYSYKSNNNFINNTNSNNNKMNFSSNQNNSYQNNNQGFYNLNENFRKRQNINQKHNSNNFSNNIENLYFQNSNKNNNNNYHFFDRQANFNNFNNRMNRNNLGGPVILKGSGGPYDLSIISPNSNFNNIVKGPKITLEQCFESFILPEYFTGENKQHCNKCGFLTDSLYSTLIYTSPNILILILNYGKGISFQCDVLFDEYINISKYIQAKDSKIPTRYRLLGAIVHIGPSSMGGHFIAFCRGIENNQQWYKLNDSIVSESNFTEIKKVGIPYVLFYENVNSY